ncbi:hypothetical protein N9222_02185 [Pseudomonadales bacterium]|nr:oxidoreductase [bacterium]MDB4494577.1 hypothetical protein [Pseudomonadales bacterium]
MFIHSVRFGVMVLIGCGLLNHVLASTPAPKLRELTTGTEASLRGVAVAGKKEAWVSGSAGTVMRTTDAGKSWDRVRVPDADELDFRDVEIPTPGTILLMAAGPGKASKLVRSVDSGKSWKVVLQNTNPEGFFDGMDFDETGKHGLLYGDPINGRLDLYVTHDGGASWKPTPPDGRPTLQQGEYGFAASGTGITISKSVAYVATGGALARVWRSTDWGQSWEVATTPVHAGDESSGIFSIGFLDANRGLVVGGDYAQPQLNEGNLARSSDGGKTWVAQPDVKLEHKACLRPLGKEGVVVCGRTGVAISRDSGKTWQSVEGGGYFTVDVDVNARVAYLAGSDGRVATLQW